MSSQSYGSSFVGSAKGRFVDVFSFCSMTRLKLATDCSGLEAPSFVQLERNPHGVGAFGTGRFHWREAPLYPNACGRVNLDSLAEELRVAIDDIDYEECVGFVVQHESGRYEVCHYCYHNLCRAGYLSKK